MALCHAPDQSGHRSGGGSSGVQKKLRSSLANRDRKVDGTRIGTTIRPMLRIHMVFAPRRPGCLRRGLARTLAHGARCVHPIVAWQRKCAARRSPLLRRSCLVDRWVGFYPLQLPDGLRGLSRRSSPSSFHDGAPGASAHAARVRSAPARRLPSSTSRAASPPERARSAKLTRMVSGRVLQTEHGFAFELRLVSASDGARDWFTQRGAVEGGPARSRWRPRARDSASCSAAMPCEGTLSRPQRGGRTGTRSSSTEKIKRALPALAARDLRSAGTSFAPAPSERRVRVSHYARETQRLFACAQSGPALTLRDENVGPGP